MSQAELARRVKLQQSTINGLIWGHQQSTTKLPQIARVLKTTPAYLEGETDDDTSDVPDISLSAEQLEWIELLDGLPAKQRNVVLQLVRTMAEAISSPTVHEKQHTYRGSD